MAVPQPRQTQLGQTGGGPVTLAGGDCLLAGPPAGAAGGMMVVGQKADWGLLFSAHFGSFLMTRSVPI